MRNTWIGAGFVAVALAVLVASNGCNCSANPVGNEDGSTSTDSGTPADAGSGLDSGAASDSGTPTDSGTPSDSGNASDSGATDSGNSSDAGNLTDSGAPADSGTLSDAGGPCTTACDCQPGLGCFNGQCIAGFAPVYCCTSSTCPTGSFCQDPAGNYGRCGGTDGGAVDAGTCQTACDCTPGLACFNGQCTQGVAPVYCCSSATCPVGSYCQDTTGAYSRCGGDGGTGDAGTCQTACDCTPGFACFGGQCTQGGQPLYCCGSTTCPPGNPCQDSTGQFSQCGFDGGFVFDAGSFCTSISCRNNNPCVNAGCTACGNNGFCTP